jgi:hypothetical protein
VYGESDVEDELQIKTHYEFTRYCRLQKNSLYMFSLPARLAIETDQVLKEKLKEDEGID